MSDLIANTIATMCKTNTKAIAAQTNNSVAVTSAQSNKSAANRGYASSRADTIAARVVRAKSVRSEN